MNKTLAAFVALVLAVPFAASATELPRTSGTQPAPAQERLDTGKAGGAQTGTAQSGKSAILPSADQKTPAMVKATEPKAPASVAAPTAALPTAPAAQTQTAAQPEKARPGLGQVEGKQNDKVPVVK